LFEEDHVVLVQGCTVQEQGRGTEGRKVEGRGEREGGEGGREGGEGERGGGGEGGGGGYELGIEDGWCARLGVQNPKAGRSLLCIFFGTLVTKGLEE
jgi:hypothetical protein